MITEIQKKVNRFNKKTPAHNGGGCEVENKKGGGNLNPRYRCLLI